MSTKPLEEEHAMTSLLLLSATFVFAATMLAALVRLRQWATWFDCTLLPAGDGEESLVEAGMSSIHPGEKPLGADWSSQAAA